MMPELLCDLSPPVQPPSAADLPRALLYATSAGLGGSGLDVTSLEGALASWRGGFLKRAICYANRQQEIPRRLVHSLQYHPVRLLANIGSADYYAAKKRWMDAVSARALRRGPHDFFHGWSGECFSTLTEARLRGVPTVMDVPTWHRNKFHVKRGETESEREARLADRGWRDWRKHLPATRQQHLAEYDLADVLLMPSLKSMETFLMAGVARKKLHYVGRGVDPARYRPGQPADIFRAVFVGALIKRKGVHHLLEAWKKLGLKNAELVLVGTAHEEMKPYLDAVAGDASVRLVGFTKSVEDELGSASVFVFPSECEGFAKATLEAAACGLPLIATSESGDAIVDGETGWVIPPNDPEALAAALERAAGNRGALAEMGKKARERVERFFTWEHYRGRMLEGYVRARGRV